MLNFQYNTQLKSLQNKFIFLLLSINENRDKQASNYITRKKKQTHTTERLKNIKNNRGLINFPSPINKY